MIQSSYFSIILSPPKATKFDYSSDSVIKYQYLNGKHPNRRGHRLPARQLHSTWRVEQTKDHVRQIHWQPFRSQGRMLHQSTIIRPQFQKADPKEQHQLMLEHPSARQDMVEVAQWHLFQHVQDLHCL